MTAAHCVPERLELHIDHVFLGHADLSDPSGIKVKIEAAIRHPNYAYDDVFGLVNDIALLKLVMPVEIGPSINTLSLPSLYEENADIEESYVVGWGYTGYEKYTECKSGTGYQLRFHPNILQELELKIMELRIIGLGFCDPESLICTENSCKSGVGPGDSGAPLMSLNSDFQYVAYGVLSTATGNCDMVFSHVAFTRVSKYIGWINSVISGQEEIIPSLSVQSNPLNGSLDNGSICSMVQYLTGPIL